DDGDSPSILQIVLASTLGLAIAAAMHYKFRKYKDGKIIPYLILGEYGRVERLERFSHYVARQMGFADRRRCPQLCKLASEYVRQSEDCEDNIYSFFANEPDADSLFVKLLEEFERCILSYFAFHWNNADVMVGQVMSTDHSEPKKKLKHIVLAATRWTAFLDPVHASVGFSGFQFCNIVERRFETVTKNLKVARVFTTLVEEMKAIGLVGNDDSCTDVMVPVAHSERSPVLLLMGGGMGAGKSTVLKDILKEPFWSGAAGNAVIVEADAFKESDVIYKALSSRGHHHDMLRTAELVHQSSTDAASSLLVTALNEGRDVIMDGTLSWEPFVVQTITMARNVHRRRYRMGVGYRVGEDGTVIENYWEQVDEEQEQDGTKKRRPYRIELVGVVCDAYLAVIRGIRNDENACRRAIVTRRAVRVRSQLRSHKRFAEAFTTYCHLVDNARLYCTNALDGPAKLIGWKDRDKTLLVDPDEIYCLKMVAQLNEEANSIYELYKRPSPALRAGSVWNDIVMSPSRMNIQQELKYSIQKIETDMMQ
ncbi:Zeta toxin domain, partial [Dillenia turbinata]